MNLTFPAPAPEDEAHYQAYARAHASKIKRTFGFDFWAGQYLPVAAPVLPIQQVKTLERDLFRLIEIVKEISQRKFNGDVLQHAEYLGLQGTLLEISTGKPERLNQSLNFARPDCLVTKSAIKVLELNIDSGIGGVADCDVLANFYRSSPVGCGNVSFYSPLEGLLRYLRTLPAPLWYLDSRPLHPDSVADAYLEYVRGLVTSSIPQAVLAEPLDLVVRDGSLHAANVTIKSVFRAISLYQYSRRFAEFMDIHSVLASRTTSLKVESDFCSLLIENKLNLAIISCPKSSPWLSPSDRLLVDQYIPWTRRLDRSVLAGVLSRPDKYVLKRGASHQANEVEVLALRNSQEIDSAIGRALQDGDWVVQQYVVSDDLEATYLMKDGFRKLRTRVLLRPFIMQGRITGLLATTLPGATKLGPFSTPGIGSIGGAAIGVAESCYDN